MSPTPTAGLGNLAGLGSLAGLGIDPSSAGAGGQSQGAAPPRDGRDRIRNVWESVRDRLGLNPRGQQDGVAPTEGDNPNEVRMRPGDMFTEMARALNIGLGLGDGNVPGARQTDATSEGDPPAGDDAEATPGATGDRAERPLPPEDSFERFLLNLQADLRAALSEDTTSHGESRRERHSVVSSAPSTSALSEDISPVAGPSSPRRSTDSAQMVDGAAQTSEHPEDEDGMPPLEDVSDSESDSDEDSEDDEDENTSHDHTSHHSEAPHSPRTPTPIPTGAFPFGPDTRHAGEGERRPPGVNLWRLYRFAPIPASHTGGHAAGTSATSTSPSPDAQPAPSPEAPTTADEPDTASASDSAPADTEPTVPAPETTTDQNANVVVPVIVVGLQSVDMNRNNENAHTHGHADSGQAQDDARSSESEPRSSGEWRDSPVPGASAGQSQSRGRSWQSRAASALRGLRPGRRASRNRQNRDAAGARTFLIYVIGGMYMPCSSMSSR